MLHCTLGGAPRRTFRGSRLGRLVLGLSLTISGCAATQATEPDATTQLVQGLQKTLTSVTERVHILEESLPLLACGPEMRALFRDIRKECNAGSAASPDGDGLKSGLPSGSCTAAQLTGAITGAERDTTHPIGQTLISLLRHEVVYVSEDGKLTSAREKRLAILASERRLPSTRFLAVTAPVRSVQDAEQRARAVIERLIQLGIPETEIVFDGEAERRIRRFDNPWVYRINVAPQLLKPADRPITPEARDPQRAVYIFRTDCQ